MYVVNSYLVDRPLGSRVLLLHLDDRDYVEYYDSPKVEERRTAQNKGFRWGVIPRSNIRGNQSLLCGHP